MTAARMRQEIKARRQALGLTQAQLAKAIGCSRWHVMRLETNRSRYTKTAPADGVRALLWSISRLEWGADPIISYETKRLKQIKNLIAPPDNNGCWNWQGGRINTTGYGKLSWKGKRVLIHRWMWKQVYGKIKTGMCVLHKCDNRLCVNPKHLYLGTSADNARDRVERARHIPNRRFTQKEVEYIKDRYTCTKSCAELAVKFDVGPPTIYAIAKGKRYTDPTKFAKALGCKITDLLDEEA
jgi:DNA-binding XRE family transcriptional regulator